MSGNYLRALLKIAPTLPAGLVTIQVLHDGWCAYYRGRPCDCDPELVVHREPADDDPRRSLSPRKDAAT